MAYDRDIPRLISQPHRVWWGGFRSTTRELQRAGWQISADQDFGRYGVRLILRNEDLQATAITNTVDFHRLAMLNYDSAHGNRYMERDDKDPWLLEFHVARMMHRMQVCYWEEYGNPFMNFRPIDAVPQMTTKKIESLEDLAIFAPPLVQTKELIVDEGEVSAILAKLAEAQRPEQERIRARNRLRESREGLELGAEPRRKFHAQILSIAA